MEACDRIRDIFSRKIDGNFQQIVLAMRDLTALIKTCAEYRTLIVSSGRT
jgi:hypothetical protein